MRFEVDDVGAAEVPIGSRQGDGNTLGDADLVEALAEAGEECDKVFEVGFDTAAVVGGRVLPVYVHAVVVVLHHERYQGLEKLVLGCLGLCHVGKRGSVWAWVVHGPASDGEPHLEPRLTILEGRNVGIQGTCLLVHGLQLKGFGVDEREGEEDVAVISQGDLGRRHGATWSLPVPALVVADGAPMGAVPSRVALRRGYNLALAVGRFCPAEAVLAAAHIQGACRRVGPLQAPAWIALALVVAGRGAVLAAKLGPKTADAVSFLVSGAG